MFQRQVFRNNLIMDMKQIPYTIIPNWCFNRDDDGSNPEISDQCKSYCEHWEEMKQNNIGIILHGNAGTGKTFMASCIANRLIYEKISVCMVSLPRIISVLQYVDDKIGVIDSLNKYKCLILDDFGAERDSSFAEEQVYNIVDARSRLQRPLIVTTNMTLKALENPATTTQSRIYDRIFEMCPIKIKMAGSSHRIKNCEERKKMAMKIIASKKPQTKAGDVSGERTQQAKNS